MIKTVRFLFVVAGLLAVVSCGKMIASNELPMYGGKAFTEWQKECNQKLIDEAIKEAGSRGAASQRAIKLAWQYFFRNDLSTAMKRFNQAWLLDEKNPEAFYGFGILSSLKRKPDDAIQFYRKAIALNPEHQMALANLARSYKDKAYAVYLADKSNRSGEVIRLMDEALLLYDKASQASGSSSDLRLSDLNADRAYIYYNWAIALEFTGEYAKAFEKLKMVRQLGGDKLIDPKFLKELSGFLKE